MARLDRLLIGRDRHPGGEAVLALGRRHAEAFEQPLGVSDLEVPLRHLLLIVHEHVAVRHAPLSIGAVVEPQIEHVIDALDIHRQPLEPVGQFARDRLAVEPPDLLEISELGHFHSVAPHLPAKPPRAQRRAFPVVLDEADVVFQRVDPDRIERPQVQRLQVGRARLQHHLILVIGPKPIGVLAIAAVGRAAARLDVRCLPRVGAQCAQHRRRVERPRPHLHVVRLEDDAAMPSPILVQRQDEVLETQGHRRQVPLKRRNEAGLWRIGRVLARRGAHRGFIRCPP